MKTKCRNFFAKLLKSGEFFTILITVVILAFFALSNVSSVNAQRKKTTKPLGKKKTTKNDTLRTEIISSPQVCVPKESEYLSILQVDKDSILTVIAQTQNGSQTLVSNKPLASLQEVLSNIDKKSIVTVKPSPMLDFGSVAKILYDTRRITDDCVNVEASTQTYNPYIYLLPEPKPEDAIVSPKPNPLTLLISLDKDGSLTLNNEKQGTLSDTSKLKKILIQIFKEREDNGVFREGTNEIEKTIFVKVAPSIKYADVIKVVDALKDAGASPIGLQIDDEDSMKLPNERLK